MFELQRSVHPVANGLLPLDGSRGLAGDVEDDSVHAGNFVGDAVRDLGEQVVGQARPVGGHRVFAGDRAQHDRVPVPTQKTRKPVRLAGGVASFEGFCGPWLTTSFNV